MVDPGNGGRSPFLKGDIINVVIYAETHQSSNYTSIHIKNVESRLEEFAFNVFSFSYILSSITVMHLFREGG